MLLLSNLLIIPSVLQLLLQNHVKTKNFLEFIQEISVLGELLAEIHLKLIEQRHLQHPHTMFFFTLCIHLLFVILHFIMPVLLQTETIKSIIQDLSSENENIVIASLDKIRGLFDSNQSTVQINILCDELLKFNIIDILQKFFASQSNTILCQVFHIMAWIGMHPCFFSNTHYFSSIYYSY